MPLWLSGTLRKQKFACSARWRYLGTFRRKVQNGTKRNDRKVKVASSNLVRGSLFKGGSEVVR